MVFWRDVSSYIIYTSEIYVPFHVQRLLVLSHSNKSYLVDIFSSKPRHPTIYNFTQIHVFHVARGAGQTDRKTDMSKIFVTLRELFSNAQIADPRQWTSLRFINTRINKNKPKVVSRQFKKKIIIIMRCSTRRPKWMSLVLFTLLNPWTSSQKSRCHLFSFLFLIGTESRYWTTTDHSHL